VIYFEELISFNTSLRTFWISQAKNVYFKSRDRPLKRIASARSSEISKKSRKIPKNPAGQVFFLNFFELRPVLTRFLCKTYHIWAREGLSRAIISIKGPGTHWLLWCRVRKLGSGRPLKKKLKKGFLITFFLIIIGTCNYKLCL